MAELTYEMLKQLKEPLVALIGRETVQVRGLFYPMHYTDSMLYEKLVPDLLIQAFDKEAKPIAVIQGKAPDLDVERLLHELRRIGITPLWVEPECQAFFEKIAYLRLDGAERTSDGDLIQDDNQLTPAQEKSITQMLGLLLKYKAIDINELKEASE